VLIIGVLQVMPLALRASVWLLALEYVVLAMPFAYRALDAGLRAIDVKTLTEAAGSLGAGWLSTMWRVILPNMRTAVTAATILIVALVLGEFTMASLDLKQTFPVWIVLFDQESEATEGIVDDGGALIGTVDATRALTLVHPGAIYLHQGATFRVDDTTLRWQAAQILRGLI